MKKKHLTEGQRYEISALLQSGKSEKEIAVQLNFSKSTVSREISRNADGRNKSYNPDLAQRKYLKRMQMRPHCKKMNYSLRLQVDILLRATSAPSKYQDISIVTEWKASHTRRYIYMSGLTRNQVTKSCINTFAEKEDITPDVVLRPMDAASSRTV